MENGSASSNSPAAQTEGGRLRPTSSDLELLSASTGREFLQTFVDLLQEVIQTDFIAISELRVTDEERIQVKAGWMDGESLESFEYDACFTPCLEAIKSAEIVLIHEDVQSAFPKDELLQHKKLESFLGYPVLNSQGEVIGLIQLGWRQQTSVGECHQILDTIRDFSLRVATELENLRTMRILEALARGPDLGSSKGVFHLIAEQIQQLLGVKAVFVAECSQQDRSTFSILAYCEGGRWLHEMEGTALSYEGRPCEMLESQEEFRIQSGLAGAYPEQERYLTAPFDSYLGVRVSDAAGNTIGHFVVFHDVPITTHKLETKLLAILRDRLGFEILRRRLEN
ncbi:GAF domain-containing protein [Parasedimentitalea maritima]|uniref:GAF domain-containing protein n=1 Tax=Parasedimentitalea maritima TaxID=2578117 RepID=A0ABY2UPK1_9RHOB|nr:GAF domain-containing protein [Zongyanglinia marina]TLP56566.1 GAF domain-containing protein [Zongyanglinia marina]